MISPVAKTVGINSKHMEGLRGNKGVALAGEAPLNHITNT